MRTNSLVGRVRKLEVRLGSIVEAMRKAADPSSAESIVQMLAAGEWQSALKLLERGHGDIGRELGPIEHLGAGPKRSNRPPD